ncbi:MAG: hypothetical protein QOD96_354, partial [Pseudonocardiales bacterium]|nr:hypothetical protein [Pseudonocardiales bacterium]
TGAGVLLAIFMRKPDRTAGPAAAASAGH